MTKSSLKEASMIIQKRIGGSVGGPNEIDEREKFAFGMGDVEGDADEEAEGNAEGESDAAENGLGRCVKCRIPSFHQELGWKSTSSHISHIGVGVGIV